MNVDFSDKSILVVDDDQNILNLILQFLLRSGLHVCGIEDAAKAIKYVEENKPDLIISDLIMPEMDGFEFCRKIKSSNEYKDIYFIFVSGEHDIKEKVTCFEIGADEYITKPFDSEELLARVYSGLRIKSLMDSLKQKNIDLKILTEELKQSKNKAEQTSKLKSQFLANMSHEIRTPLNSILGFTDILELKEKDPEKKGQLKVVCRAGIHLLNIINDILDFSKIEAGKLQIEKNNFSLVQLLYHIESIISVKTSEKKLAFELNLDESIPDIVYGDRHRINQVILNFLSNSVKFTKRGKIILSCKYSVNSESAQITVADTGVGISKENIKRIFNEFEQEYYSTTREFGGTGLGLTISKKLVELLQGTIFVKSELGKGSTFILDLPLPEVSPNKQIDIIDYIEERTDISDDEFIGKKMVTQWLQSMKSIPELEDLFWKTLSQTLPEGMSNLEKAIIKIDKKEIKFCVHNFKGIVGSFGMKEIYNILVKIEDEISKDNYDINKIKKQFNELKNIIQLIPSEYFEEEIINERTLKYVKSNFDILVVDDNEMNRKLIKTLLNLIEMNCDLAENGHRALEMIKNKRYDLILLDMYMPVMNGIETIRYIRNDEVLKDLYVIALTASAMKGDADKFLKAGCNDYISKPINREIFYEKVNKLVRKKKKILINYESSS